MKDFLQTLAPGGTDWRIATQLDPQRLPAHVAIIMDGNGRWARRRSYPRLLGHKAGIDVVRKVVEASAQLGLQALTLYAFSVENWKRPRHEIEGLWRLLRFYLRREVPALMRNNVRLRAIGRIESLPQVVRAELLSATEMTAANTGMQLNLAINYGGRTEIVDAVNSLLQEAQANGSNQIPHVTEEMLAQKLYTAPLCDPDLLIRTSGEMRISNFLLWQIAYAEIYVTETLWPDFAVTDLLLALQDFQSRDRRFGGLSDKRQAAAAVETAEDPLLSDGESLSISEEEAAELPVV